MARIESWFRQDLKEPVHVQMIQGNVFSQDEQANLIGVRVTDNGEAAVLGGTVSASIIRADGATVAQAGTLSGNSCSVILPAAAYAVPGPLVVALKLTQNGVVTTVLVVAATVYRTSTDSVVDPGTIIPSIQDLIDDIDAAVASIPPDYSSLNSAVGYEQKGSTVIAQSNIIQGSYDASGGVTPSSTRIRTSGFIPVYNGEMILFSPGTNATQIFYGAFNKSKEFIADGQWISNGTISVNWDGYIILMWRKSTNNENIEPSEYDATTTIITKTAFRVDKTMREIPVLRNGSAANAGNARAIATEGIMPIIPSYDQIIFEFVGDISKTDSYAFHYVLFKGASDGMTSVEAVADQSIIKEFVNIVDPISVTSKTYIRINVDDITDYDHIAFGLWGRKNGEYIILRVPEEQYSFKISYVVSADPDRAKKAFLNACHVPNDSVAPFSIAHFSDTHADTKAVSRILKDIDASGLQVNDIICTGDMVANGATEIASWWPSNVLTCIGNHDSASYNSETGYDWASLSMSDRDAYYIAPFENNWGITHESGKSYYYKDYSTQKVRMIVLDSQLYITNGTEATAQTGWLENLLAGAISGNLHVLIAIHAPYGGSPVVDCSFSKYGRTNMVSLTDSFTPAVVVEAVSAAITGGLKFIGYIVGHNHQDYIYKPATGQLGFCVTCAAVEYKPQWTESDQHRGIGFDAYNVVIVDTANTLVKVIRYGGADMDDKMRARKAICFNYSTGVKVGEML